ncbi:nucleotidyl transferase AbiEii/AbiGii toxin family protein [Mycetocola saprophilus]|uniref:nucleotidyl transferase AbiEii/AbiGii toxin family protein n=1 Tax=Mycetocola saprophilus TaxID=76636 RepID=UPI001B80E547|nr:nucleotidyl transferase AbiEii/AbiGii toxin family protein [Mycetocola saprophilus]
MSSELVYRRVQALARSTGAKNGTRAPTQEYLIRHALESFVDRLNRSRHSKDFVLKGGILLGAYGVRRPTQDVDSNAIGLAVSPENLAGIVREIAGLDIDDGLDFNLDSLTIREIREDAEYPALRLRIGVRIASWRGTISWDVSTGDPIVPPPRIIKIDRILGEPIVMLGFAAESTVAEKASPFLSGASQIPGGATMWILLLSAAEAWTAMRCFWPCVQLRSIDV